MNFNIINLTKKESFLTYLYVKEDITIEGDQISDLCHKIQEEIELRGWEKTDKYLCQIDDSLPFDSPFVPLQEKLAYSITYDLNNELNECWFC